MSQKILSFGLALFVAFMAACSGGGEPQSSVVVTAYDCKGDVLDLQNRDQFILNGQEVLFADQGFANYQFLDTDWNQLAAGPDKVPSDSIHLDDEKVSLAGSDWKITNIGTTVEGKSRICFEEWNVNYIPPTVTPTPTPVGEIGLALTPTPAYSCPQGEFNYVEIEAGNPHYSSLDGDTTVVIEKNTSGFSIEVVGEFYVSGDVSIGYGEEAIIGDYRFHIIRGYEDALCVLVTPP